MGYSRPDLDVSASLNHQATTSSPSHHTSYSHTYHFPFTRLRSKPPQPLDDPSHSPRSPSRPLPRWSSPLPRRIVFKLVPNSIHPSKACSGYSSTPGQFFRTSLPFQQFPRRSSLWADQAASSFPQCSTSISRGCLPLSKRRKLLFYLGRVERNVGRR